MPRMFWGGAKKRLPQEVIVLKWALIFFIISVVAGLLGFTNVAAGTRSIARVFFAIFIFIFLIVLILALTGISFVAG